MKYLQKYINVYTHFNIIYTHPSWWTSRFCTCKPAWRNLQTSPPRPLIHMSSHPDAWSRWSISVWGSKRHIFQRVMICYRTLQPNLHDPLGPSHIPPAHDPGISPTEAQRGGEGFTCWKSWLWSWSPEGVGMPKGRGFVKVNQNWLGDFCECMWGLYCPGCIGIQNKLRFSEPLTEVTRFFWVFLKVFQSSIDVVD